MKFFHTSDWHLGNRLLGHSRSEEFRQFLNWLLEQMESEKPDALLISGDIFDTATPSESARELYCDFLSRADATGCRRIIVTAGNHDSAAQLEVTGPLLARYHSTLVARLTSKTAEDCLIPVTDAEGREKALICAVPYLRVGEVSLPAPADDEAARKSSYTRGIAAVYEAVGACAAAWKEANPGCPVIGMGHLCVTGIDKTASTRDIIGTDSSVNADIFPDVFDYTALGHIHKPSGEPDTRHRYCGSPLAMGMDEGAYEHKLLILETEGTRCRTRELPVPRFTQMVQRRCHSEEEVRRTAAELRELVRTEGHPLWLDMAYAGATPSVHAIRTLLTELLPEEEVPVTHVHPGDSAAPGERQAEPPETTLDNYSPLTLFERRMAEFAAEHPDLTDDKQADMRELFRSILAQLPDTTR